MTEAIEFTSDPFEQEILLSDHLAIVEPDDPLYREVEALADQLTILRSKMTPLMQKIAPLLQQGMSPTKIIDRLGTTYNSISKAKNDRHVLEAVAIHERMHRLNVGPQERQRAAMLWRIALRNEESKPNITISAIDTLNKQAGIYRPDQLGVGDGEVNVTINQFNIDQRTSELAVKDITPTKAQQHEKFEPITIEVP